MHCTRKLHAIYIQCRPNLAQPFTRLLDRHKCCVSRVQVTASTKLFVLANILLYEMYSPSSLSRACFLSLLNPNPCTNPKQGLVSNTKDQGSLLLPIFQLSTPLRLIFCSSGSESNSLKCTTLHSTPHTLLAYLGFIFEHLTFLTKFHLFPNPVIIVVALCNRADHYIFAL